MHPEEPKSETGGPAPPESPASSGHPPLLRKIRRARTRLIVCLWTLPVYMAAVWVLLRNGQPVEMLMLFYFLLCAGFWLDMAMRKCPACKNSFT